MLITLFVKSTTPGLLSFPRPKHRVNLILPFLHTDADFTGHLWFQNGKEDKKIYLLIFTCQSGAHRVVRGYEC